MQNMMDFIGWFLSQLPAFLMSEPICYFVGFAFLFVIVAIFRSLVTIHRF